MLGRLPRALPDEGISADEAPIGQWATEVVRQAAGAHAFFSTSSSFRGGLPAGEVTVEDLYAALPYRNVVALAEMTGAQLLRVADTGGVEARGGRLQPVQRSAVHGEGRQAGGGGAR